MEFLVDKVSCNNVLKQGYKATPRSFNICSKRNLHLKLLSTQNQNFKVEECSVLDVNFHDRKGKGMIL